MVLFSRAMSAYLEAPLSFLRQPCYALIGGGLHTQKLEVLVVGSFSGTWRRRKPRNTSWDGRCRVGRGLKAVLHAGAASRWTHVRKYQRSKLAGNPCC